MHHHGSHRFHNKTQRETALALLLLCGAAGLWIGRPIFHLTSESTTGAADRGSPFKITGTPTPAPAPTTIRSVRRIYGHALVAGGIRSADELMALITRDPQLAEHYKNFDLSKAHMITLDHDVVAYVSYRLAGGIYWAARPSIIAKGEQVITDGTNFIRARCGNLISYAAGLPTSYDEPQDMDIVVALTAVDPGGPTAPDGVVPNPVNGNLPMAAPPALAAVPGEAFGGGSLPPEAPIMGGGGGWPTAAAANPPIHFSADEFSTISLRMLGHAYTLPTEELALLAGVLLAVILRLALWRQG